MTQQSTLAPHETLELHELLRSEIHKAKKIQVNIEQVEDNELKSYMQEVLTAKKNRIAEIISFADNQGTNQQLQ